MREASGRCDGWCGEEEDKASYRPAAVVQFLWPSLGLRRRRGDGGACDGVRAGDLAGGGARGGLPPGEGLAIPDRAGGHVQGRAQVAFLPQAPALRPGPPAFKDHLTTVFESRAICRYICDQYADHGNQALLGKKEDGAVGRAAIEQWIEAESQSFNPPSLAIIFQLAFAPMMGRATDMAVVEQNEVKLTKVLDVYDQRLGENQYFAGDDFSLADLVHLPNADFLVNRTNKAGLITERKNLARWWDDVSTRPAWKKVIEMQSAPRPS